jgi:cysteine-rich repeat protein
MRWWIAVPVALVAGCAYSDQITDPSPSSASSGGGGGWSTVDTGVGGVGAGPITTASSSASSGGGGAIPGCGDGIVDPGEECDDGNEQADDGCSSCIIECEPAAAKDPSTGHCYRVFAIASAWGDAEASCKAWGGGAGLGHLVSIGDASEQAFVAGLVTQAAWIGGGDAVTEGVYTWTDGTPWTYEIWAPNEPNDTTVEDCVFMRADGDWDDHDCAYEWPSYVCERRGAGTF